MSPNNSRNRSSFSAGGRLTRPVRIASGAIIALSTESAPFSAATTAASFRPRSVWSILRMPGMGPAMLASLTVLSVIDVMVVYLPALGQERGLSVAVVGALLSVRGGASMVSRLAVARVVKQFGDPRLQALVFLAQIL